MRCAVRVIACVDDPVVIRKILSHLKNKAVSMPTGLLPEERDGPQMGEGAGGIQ